MQPNTEKNVDPATTATWRVPVQTLKRLQRAADKLVGIRAPVTHPPVDPEGIVRTLRQVAWERRRRRQQRLRHHQTGGIDVPKTTPQQLEAAADSRVSDDFKAFLSTFQSENQPTPEYARCALVAAAQLGVDLVLYLHIIFPFCADLVFEIQFRQVLTDAVLEPDHWLVLIEASKEHVPLSFRGCILQLFGLQTFDGMGIGSRAVTKKLDSLARSFPAHFADYILTPVLKSLVSSENAKLIAFLMAAVPSVPASHLEPTCRAIVSAISGPGLQHHARALAALHAVVASHPACSAQIQGATLTAWVACMTVDAAAIKTVLLVVKGAVKQAAMDAETKSHLARLLGQLPWKHPLLGAIQKLVRN
ncbi:hypothetical protein BC828DRAFT_387243 [Blastocladiella britannica]|nr:hypothetical protein BC828DRAFT_387243 [Blastocladiella britannica]